MTVKLNEKHKVLIVSLIIISIAIELYFHRSQNAFIISHLLYIPIILAATWWKRKAFFIIIFILLLQYAAIPFVKTISLFNLNIRSFIFLLIGTLIIFLSEKKCIIEDKLKETNQNLEKKVEERTIELDKANKNLVTSNNIKELFLDIIRHDIINPLNVSRSYIELLLEDEKNKKKKRYLDKINNNIGKTLEITENSTMLSQLENLESIPLEQTDLKEIVETVIKNYNPLLTEKKMKIENNINTPMPVKANKILEEVFSNFISNAVKYAEHGKRIVFENEGSRDLWRIRVKDYGEGVEDRYKDRIFDRFNRLEKMGVKGSGLGLAIAKKIAELHNGRLFVEDNPEGGAVFIFEMPKSNN